ncbi:DUF3016 domain-containing protein [Kinneretia aquatilis]|uniref:DUF3016 domain-containing protein n=1 Tax=Kinneretia aquatilis TaxID=2070761 RepID=UPI0014951CE7|nr:DUF3016 domain-containing protein [Paucibacter aquatile]WIV99827.1 DUF3016 domain-containing protein [Paucibacter aquatile]
MSMNKTSRFRAAALALALGASASLALADVQVRFIEPDKFTDASSDFGRRDQEPVLKELKAHLEKLGAQLPGKDLTVEISNVDLAGGWEPVGRRMDMIRVLRGVSSPSIELSFSLSENGKVLQSGKTRLHDLNYMVGMNRYNESDPIRYERRLLDDWFREEFKTTLAAAKN